MQKKLTAIFIAILTFLPAMAAAMDGVIVDLTGKVEIAAPGGKARMATKGAEFTTDSKIKTGRQSSAVLFFKDGSVKKMGGLDNYTVISGKPAADVTLFSGAGAVIADAGRKGRDSSAHMMVKKQAVKKEEITFKKTSDPITEDIQKVNSLNLSADSNALLKAEVYNRYSKYQDVVNTLKPYCPPNNCSNEAGKRLMKNAYQSLGNKKLAADY